MSFQAVQTLDDDGLYLPVVGAWAERKYRLIASYAQMFSSAMKSKWDVRVYLDLFAAAGRAKIKETDRIVPTSASLAIGVRDPFDKHVFCEIDPRCIEALEERVRRSSPGIDVCFVAGDCNTRAEEILRSLPSPSRGRTVLSFCVVDPCKMRDLQFSTISALSERFVDFLILIPSYMDAHRNLESYERPESSIVSSFLGNPHWRDRWSTRHLEAGPRDFGAFIVDSFGLSMRDLNFLYDGPDDTVPVFDKHLLLYHLAFFSRSERGRDFWRKAKRSSADQLKLGPW